MAVIETNGHFDTDAVRRLLDEYEHSYRQHSQHLAAIACQSILLIEDAARLYEENTKLRELVSKMAYVFDVDSGWCDQHCYIEFQCDTLNCPITKVMDELGIKFREVVDE